MHERTPRKADHVELGRMAEKRILIVDDDPEIRAFVAAIADKCGFISRSVESVAALKVEYARFQPDLTVLDLSLEDGDGIEVLEFLAGISPKAHVCLISGFEDRIISTAIRVGKSYGLEMIGHLRKPISGSALKDTFDRLPSSRIAVRVADVEAALAEDRLTLAYQPKLDLHRRKVVGVEALVRINDPDRGLVFPDQFIPLAEEAGLIDRLTDRILEIAVAQARIWRDSGLDLGVAVNLSASALTDLAFPRRVISLLETENLEPRRLILEITETTAMKAPDRAMDILTRLRIRGVSLALDDFGTGYSSLVELHRMPFSEVKIDKSFVMSSDTDKDARVIVSAILKLAHAMNLEVVAEGVETMSQLELLCSLNCDLAQGYVFSRPLLPDALVAWLQEPLSFPDSPPNASDHAMAAAE